MFALATLVVFCLASSTVTASSVLTKPHYDLEEAENVFKDFINKYGKIYNQFEYFERLEIFKNTLKDINRRNAKHPKTVFAVNRFSDMTKEEQKRFRGFKMPAGKREKLTIPDSLDPAPDSLDYRTQNLVTHVKDQGQCGSCYIFSAMGNIEGQYAKKHQKLLAFSEGQCLDCLDNGSCGGGRMDDVMIELAKTKGLELEDDYPYTDEKSSCKENTTKAVAKLKGGAELDIPNEDVLKQKLADIGPLAVGLNANDFDSYESGILEPDLCTDEDPDHGVVLVGYGQETDGTKYWIIKNSWGTTWGEKGYVRLLRGVDACKMGTSFTAAAEVE